MDSEEKWADSVITEIRRKMAWVSEKNKDKIPYTTYENGSYDDHADMSRKWNPDDGLSWWTNGFWAGILWLLYQDTDEERYASIARNSEKRMEKCFQDFYGLHHDVGFMYMPTAVADWRLTANPDSRKNAMHAATLLAGRFNPVGKFIRAWNYTNNDTRGWAIIDSMFNLSLLYWASEESKDPRFRQIAMMHADTVMKRFIRSDGSARHIVEFDPETGEMVSTLAGQGYDSNSAWTRGQGWALYGFMISYLHTHKTEYLTTARRVADYCVAHIPESGIFPADFCQPSEPAWEDSSAALIIAGGLLELAKQLPELDRQIYEKTAAKILHTIVEKRADFSENCDAIVQNCSVSYHGDGHNINLIYADYFFIEDIYKLKGIGINMW